MRYSHRPLDGTPWCVKCRSWHPTPVDYKHWKALLCKAKPPGTDRTLQGCCIDCGRKYGDEYGFPDLVIPDEDWKAISPNHDEGGLLCPSCICRRLYDLGIETTGKFTSGPLCET